MRKIHSIILILTLMIIGACDDFALIEELDGPEGKALTVTPLEYQLPINDTITLTVEGGYFGYSFEILEGGGIVDTETFTYTAPGTTGTVIIRVTDQAGNHVDIHIIVIEAVIGNTRVDYSVGGVTGGGSAVTEGVVSGTFAIENAGTAAGNYQIGWQVYASTDTTVGDNDFLIVSGTTGELLAGGTTDVSYSGLWPAVRGTYYLVATITSLDDESETNNQAGTSGAATITDPPPPDVDYVVLMVTSTGSPGETGSVIVESFTYTNQGGDDGEDPVYWTAYTSLDDEIDASDGVIDSGEAAPLLSGATSGAVDIDAGLWPGAAGNYFLIVEVAAADETAGWNNSTASGAFEISTSGAIDYYVTAVSSYHTTGVTGGAVSETFDLKNLGDTDGLMEVNWTAYASTDTIAVMGEDTIVAGGTTPALTSGAQISGIDVTGTWPGSIGSYYLIIEVSADENPSEESNNTSFAGPFFVVESPNYSVTDTPPAMPGDSLKRTPFSGDFTIRETTGNAGTEIIEWVVYLSEDAGIGGDTVLSYGTIPPLDGNEEVLLTFDGTWSESSGETYYIILAIDSDDDADDSDDVYVSLLYVTCDLLEIEPNDEDDPMAEPINPVHDLGPLSLSTRLIIQGNVDGPGVWDTYKFELPASVSSTDEVRTSAVWSSGTDALNLMLWDGRGAAYSSAMHTTDGESGVEVTNWSDSDVGYVGVDANENGTRYYLRVMFVP